MSSGWGCPHENKNRCMRVLDRPCDPGMKGCVLAGRFIFTDQHKNTASIKKKKQKPQLKKHEKE